MKFLKPISLFLALSTNIYAQNKNALQIDVLPFALVEQNGTGLQVALQRQVKDKFFIEMRYGIIYDFIAQSGYTSPKTNGVPIGAYTTEVLIKNAASNNNNFPDKGLIADLNRLGFKQVTPYESQRLDNFGVLSIGMNMRKLKKWTFSPQLGLVIGLSNKTEIAGGVTSNLGDNAFIGTNAPVGWIVFQVYARYWYIGAASKITIERRLKDHVYLGIPIGLNYIFDKNFKTDDLILYTGLSFKINFLKDK